MTPIAPFNTECRLRKTRLLTACAAVLLAAAASASRADESITTPFDLRLPMDWKADATEFLGIKLHRTLAQQVAKIVPCKGSAAVTQPASFGDEAWVLEKGFTSFCYYPAGASATSLRLLNGPTFSFPYEAAVEVDEVTKSVTSIKLRVLEENYESLKNALLMRFGTPTGKGALDVHVLGNTERLTMVRKKAEVVAWSGAKGFLFLMSVNLIENQAEVGLTSQAELSKFEEASNEATRKNSELF